MDGEGFYTWRDGRTYKGGYLKGKKSGYGIYTWPDGKKFEGNWRNGVQHG